MKTRPVIKNVPTHLGLNTFVLWWFLLDYYNVSPIWKGIQYAIMGMLFINFLTRTVLEKKIDIFDLPDADKPAKDEKVNKFTERLREALKNKS